MVEGAIHLFSCFNYSNSHHHCQHRYYLHTYGIQAHNMCVTIISLKHKHTHIPTKLFTYSKTYNYCRIALFFANVGVGVGVAVCVCVCEMCSYSSVNVIYLLDLVTSSENKLSHINTFVYTVFLVYVYSICRILTIIHVHSCTFVSEQQICLCVHVYVLMYKIITLENN